MAGAARGLRRRGRFAGSVALALVALLSAHCAGPKEPLVTSAQTTAMVSGIDWSQTELIDIAMNEFDYRPDHLSLRVRQPYILRFVNTGSVAHTFTAPTFFQSVAFRETDAARRVQDAGGTLALAAGEGAELQVVPERSGTFPVACERPLHALFGMTGEIVVQ